MMSRAQVRALVELRPAITNVIGFYLLIEDDTAKTAYDAMTNEVHFKAASMKIAAALIPILDELDAALREDGP